MTTWISYNDAARLLGTTTAPIRRLQQQGRLPQRQAPRRAPSIDRDALLTAWEQLQQEDTEAAAARQRAKHVEPPDQENHWVSAGVVAIMLSISPRRVNQLAAAEKLPSAQRAPGHRRWFRLDHIELIAAARIQTSRANPLA